MRARQGKPEGRQDAGVLLSKHTLNLLPRQSCTLAQRAVPADAVLPILEGLPAVRKSSQKHLRSVTLAARQISKEALSQCSKLHQSQAHEQFL